MLSAICHICYPVAFVSCLRFKRFGTSAQIYVSGWNWRFLSGGANCPATARLEAGFRCSKGRCPPGHRVWPSNPQRPTSAFMGDPPSHDSSKRHGPRMGLTEPSIRKPKLRACASMQLLCNRGNKLSLSASFRPSTQKEVDSRLSQFNRGQPLHPLCGLKLFLSVRKSRGIVRGRLHCIVHRPETQGSSPS